MKKLFLILLLLVIGIGGYSLLQKFTGTSTPSETVDSTQPSVSSLVIGDTRYSIEIADDDNERSIGLSNRDSLPADQGMLFIFNNKDRYSFWMRGMRFALDFLWIDGDTVVDLTENVPAPLTETYAPLYQPKVPVDKVLEVNAGEIKKHSFTVGQKVTLTLINPQETSSETK